MEEMFLSVLTISLSSNYSFVEAITEFLPISSTAHLMLLDKIVLSHIPYQAFDFDLFCVLSQLAAILAVVIVFWRPVWQHKNLWGKLLLAVIPTGLFGVALHGVIKNYLQDASPLTGWMLIIFGVIFSLLDVFWEQKKPTGKISDHLLTTKWSQEVEKTPWYKMLGIGLGQSLALIPGVSRSGASIYTARALGFSKVAATALSFIIAVPVIAGAAGLDIVKDIHEMVQIGGQCDGSTAELAPKRYVESIISRINQESNREYHPQTFVDCPLPLQTQSYLCIAIYCTLTFVISLFVCKKLLKILASKPFWYFGVWRLVIGIVWLFLFWPKT